MYTLTKKDSTEYTGLEYWIFDKMKNGDTSWYIPIIYIRFPMINTDNNTFTQNFDQLKDRMVQLEQMVDQRTEVLSEQLNQIIFKQSQKNGS